MQLGSSTFGTPVLTDREPRSRAARGRGSAERARPWSAGPYRLRGAYADGALGASWASMSVTLKDSFTFTVTSDPSDLRTCAS